VTSTKSKVLGQDCIVRHQTFHQLIETAILWLALCIKSTLQKIKNRFAYCSRIFIVKLLQSLLILWYRKSTQVQYLRTWQELTRGSKLLGLRPQLRVFSV
jgi:hypothetical protein